MVLIVEQPVRPVRHGPGRPPQPVGGYCCFTTRRAGSVRAWTISAWAERCLCWAARRAGPPPTGPDRQAARGRGLRWRGGCCSPPAICSDGAPARTGGTLSCSLEIGYHLSAWHKFEHRLASGVHCKKVCDFPVPSLDDSTKLYHYPNSRSPYISKLFPVRKSLVKDIPARDRKVENLFLQCTHIFRNQISPRIKNLNSKSVHIWITSL